MLYYAALHDLALFLHSSGRGVNLVLHEAEVLCESKSMLYDQALHDLALFLHSSNRGGNVILHEAEAEACVSQSQCCMMERRKICHCSCTVVAEAHVSFCMRQKQKLV